MHHQITDFDKPDRFDPAARAEILAEAREQIRTRILALDVDPNGNVHRGEVLATLEEET